MLTNRPLNHHGTRVVDEDAAADCGCPASRAEHFVFAIGGPICIQSNEV